MRKWLYVNGGNVIMVQVENEYGSYGMQMSNCEKGYLAKIRCEFLNNHYIPLVFKAQ